MRTATLAVVATVPLFMATSTTGSPDVQSQKSDKPEVVSVKLDLPPRKIEKERKFKAWAQPSPQQIRIIAGIEAKKWGAEEQRLLFRINCESTFRWNAGNGQYKGLGQFADSTFDRGMGSIRTRRVRYEKTSVKKVVVARVAPLSDGTVKRKKAWTRKQFVTTKYKGTIPQDAPTTHGWAQVRIMAQAMVGKSAVKNSEWDPKCQ